MLLRQIAIVSQTTKVSPEELATVSAAIQKQVTRDFGPVWDVTATIDCFPSSEQVPAGYWPMFIRDNISGSAHGVHQDDAGQPLALIRWTKGWSLSASHECLEMLGDPTGKQLIAGQSIKADQGRVEYLVEVCDPCQDSAFGYYVNDVFVSDFYTPHYFDAVRNDAVQYSQNKYITEPRQVLPGGYLTWHAPDSGKWWQAINDGAMKFAEVTNMNMALASSCGSVRAAIDRLTTVDYLPRLLKNNERMAQLKQRRAQTVSTSKAKAKRWDRRLEQILKDAEK